MLAHNDDDDDYYESSILVFWSSTKSIPTYSRLCLLCCLVFFSPRPVWHDIGAGDFVATFCHLYLADIAHGVCGGLLLGGLAWHSAYVPSWLIGSLLSLLTLCNRLSNNK